MICTNFEIVTIRYLMEVIACFKNIFFQQNLCLILCKNRKGFGTSFWVTVLVKFFDQVFYFVVYKLAKFH